jgi:hypothetical protein
VGGAGEDAGGVVAVVVGEFGVLGEEARGGDAGVPAGAREVGDAAAGGVFDRLAGGEGGVVPGGLVPAAGEDERVGGGGAGEGGEVVEDGRGGAVGGEVEAGEGRSGGGEVDVGVDEGGQDQPAAEVFGAVGGGRVGLVADPLDAVGDGEQGRRGGTGRAEDAAAAPQDAFGRCGAGLLEEAHASHDVSRRGAGCGGGSCGPVRSAGWRGLRRAARTRR